MTRRRCTFIAMLAALSIVGGVATGSVAQSQTPARKATPDTRRVQDPEPADAAKTDRPAAQQSTSPIVIDADRMEAFQREGLVIFTGNVVAKQDNSVQTADRMEVYLDDKGERVLRLISTGNVRIVTEDCRTGTARRAEFYDDEQRLLLIGDAKVWQEENVVTGEEIEILLAEDRSTVTGGPRERVKAIFYPKREDASQRGGAPAAAEQGEGQPPSCG